MDIELKHRVKLLRKMMVSDLSGEKVMIDFDSGKYFLLKGVANDIWEYIQEDIEVKEIITKLMTEYEVSENVCIQSVFEFLEKLKKYSIIELN